MVRWIGSNNPNGFDTAESGFNRRCKENRQDLDDLIHYLEYVKDTGRQATRVDIKQEEHWATLIRDLLVEKIIKNVTSEGLFGLFGGSYEIVRYECAKCESPAWVSLDSKSKQIIAMSEGCTCGTVKMRIADIVDYIERFVKRNKHE